MELSHDTFPFPDSLRLKGVAEFMLLVLLAGIGCLQAGSASTDSAEGIVNGGAYGQYD
jgi:hypothetical protein